MADTMESEEAITTNKEPVKNEESATSTSNTDGRNEDASSPPPNCSICLGKLINTSFTDSCLHQFCFTCLLQWSRIKTECPLCKQTFKSIIHNVRSEEDYDQYHVPRELAQPPPASQIVSAIEVAFNVERAPLERRRFAYRTTMLHNRLFEIRLNPGQDPLRNIPLLSREERRNRRANPIAFRRNIYRTGEWSNPVPDIYSRFRECSAEYFRRHPQEHDRLIPWINRELLTLLNANQPHIAYVSRVIMDTLIRYDIRSPEFHETVRPYFNIHTAHFIHELMNYCRSSLSVNDYDALVTYSPCNPVQVAGFSGGYWNRVQSPISSSTSNSSTSDDSDVRVVEHVDNANIDLSRTNVEMPAIPLTYSELYMPGPSTVSETFQVNTNNNNNNVDNNNVSGGRVATRSPCVLTILSSASSDSDECEVVGYVKPRHERTPEIIELVSSDDERIITTENIAESESPPKTSTVIPINDENPCTSNANNERSNTRNNQKPKSNTLKLRDLTTASLSSSQSMFDSDSDSDNDSDFVIRPAQKRSRGRNAKRNVKKSARKSPRKSLRKRNKNSTSGSIDGKRESKRRRNSSGIGSRIGRNVAAIISSSSEEENNAIGDNSEQGGWHLLKVRKDLIIDARRRNNSRSSSSSSDKSSSSSNSSTSTSSTSSSSATSNTTSTASNIFGSTASLNCHNSVNNHSNDDGIRKKNKLSRNDSRNKVKTDTNAFENDNPTKKKSSRPKLKSTVVKCQRPVNSTVLRKDVDKKEWYIDNNRQSRSRSRSRSSYESQCDTNLQNNSRRRRHHRRRRSNSNNSVDNYRERRMASRIANEKLKNQSLYSTADSQNDDDDEDEIDVGDNTQYNYERSNSQSSTISGKYSNSSKNDKHNSKCKNNTKKKYIKESKNENGSELLDVASTSTSNQKYSENKNNACGKKRSNSNRLHKKSNKDSKQRRMSSSSKPKSRRDKRRRTHSFSSSSSSSLLSSTSSSSSSE